MPAAKTGGAYVTKKSKSGRPTRQTIPQNRKAPTVKKAAPAKIRQYPKATKQTSSLARSRGIQTAHKAISTSDKRAKGFKGKPVSTPTMRRDAARKAGQVGRGARPFGKGGQKVVKGGGQLPSIKLPQFRMPSGSDARNTIGNSNPIDALYKSISERIQEALRGR